MTRELATKAAFLLLAAGAMSVGVPPALARDSVRAVAGAVACRLNGAARHALGAPIGSVKRAVFPRFSGGVSR